MLHGMLGGMLQSDAYLSFVVDKGNAQIWHGSEDGHQRLDRIAVDHRPVLFEIVGRKSALVDNPNP